MGGYRAVPRLHPPQLPREHPAVQCVHGSLLALPRRGQQRGPALRRRVPGRAQGVPGQLPRELRDVARGREAVHPGQGEGEREGDLRPHGGRRAPLHVRPEGHAPGCQRGHGGDRQVPGQGLGRDAEEVEEGWPLAHRGLLSVGRWRCAKKDADLACCEVVHTPLGLRARAETVSGCHEASLRGLPLGCPGGWTPGYAFWLRSQWFFVLSHSLFSQLADVSAWGAPTAPLANVAASFSGVFVVPVLATMRKARQSFLNTAEEAIRLKVDEANALIEELTTHRADCAKKIKDGAEALCGIKTIR